MSRSLLCRVVLLLSASIAVTIASSAAWACTTAVISGRATADGRPLLWKNRDFSQPNNEVVYFHEKGLPFVAVVNAGATRNVYMGVNSAGFCIENSLSKDLTGEAGEGPGNGRLMKAALARCRTVDDFEQLLERTNAEGRRTRANFGVIDAQGGAAMFETGPRSFTKFDANDPRDAPQGFIVRSNFSATARKLSHVDEQTPLEGVYSARRFRRGCRLCRDGLESGRLDARYLLRHVTRDLSDEQGRPLPGSVNGRAGSPLPPVIDTDKTLNRKTTVSAAVFQGVRPGEAPRLTTMWVLLGQPAFTVAVPCWAAAGELHPALDGPQVSRLCTLSRRLRDLHYPEHDAALHRGALPGVWTLTFAVEDAIYRRIQRQLSDWRADPPSAEDLAKSHRKACERALRCVEQLNRSNELLALERRPLAAAQDDAE